MDYTYLVKTAWEAPREEPLVDPRYAAGGLAGAALGGGLAGVFRSREMALTDSDAEYRRLKGLAAELNVETRDVNKALLRRFKESMKDSRVKDLAKSGGGAKGALFGLGLGGVGLGILGVARGYQQGRIGGADHFEPADTRYLDARRF